MNLTKEMIEISWNRISRLVELTSAYVYRDKFNMGYMNSIAERSIAIEMLISDHLPSLEKMKYQLIEMISRGRDLDGISIGMAWQRYCYLMNLVYNFIVMLCDNKQRMDREIEVINEIISFDENDCSISYIISSLS